MDPTPASALSDIRTLLVHIESIFANLNVGLLVYHLEDVDEAARLKLVYANKAASTFTGTDLQQRVDRYILDAFPSLAGTEIPQIYRRVVNEQKARELGSIEYEDATMQKSHYSVKAFPMPYDCVGVVFENITLRKKVDDMVIHLNEQLKAKNQDHERLVAAITQNVRGPAHDLKTYAETLQQRVGEELAAEEQALLDELVETVVRLTRIIDALQA